MDFLRCFSLVQNTTKIFNTTVTPKMITSVNGIRVISMFWIILGHTFLFMLSSGIVGEYRRARVGVPGHSYHPKENLFKSEYEVWTCSALCLGTI